jgi:hypothetical protein
MSFYSDASLVLIPSGYKDQKVYCAVPTDGAADLTFSRASNATRVASNGLIEKVRTNQLLQSNNFSNAYWTKVNATITAGQSDPNGGTSAFKIDFASGANAYLGVFGLGAGLKTNSVFLRADSSVQIGFANGQNSNAVTLTTSWVRYQIAQTGTSGAGFQLDNYFGVTTPQLGITIYAFQAQLEDGDIATDYIATTTAAVSVGPVSGLPRLDYLNSTCPRLLLEPQRTNAFLYSEQFDNAYWVKSRATIAANSVVSPDGYTNADVIFPDSTPNTSHEIFNNTSTGSQNMWSGFFKMQGHRWVGLFGSGDPVIYYDLQNGVVGNVGAGLTAKIEDYGNGWYRCSYIKNSGTNTVWGFGLAGGNGSPTISGTPNTSQGVAIYGFQAEAATYATSYIPTLGTSVTRVADAATKTGISSLIGQTEGTIFVEINFDLGVIAPDNSRIQLSDGTTSNWIFIAFPDGSASNLIRIYANGSSGSMSEYSTNSIVSGVNKIAYGYKSGSFVLYVNGVQEASSSSTITIPTCSRIDLTGSSPAVINALERTNYNQALLFKTRLTNESLASLTSL